MNVPLRLPLSLLLFLLSAHVLSPIAEAQNAASAAAEDLAAETAPSDTQEEEKGLWDGIFSSIVDFFVDESPDAESDDSQNLQDTEGKDLAGQQDVEVSAVTEDNRRCARKRASGRWEPRLRPISRIDPGIFAPLKSKTTTLQPATFIRRQ